MNGYKFLASVIVTSVIISGCASTEENDVVKYQSRCQNVEAEEPDGFVQKLLSRQAPRYPIEAARNKVEGYVILVHDINAQGKTTNIDVIEASPSNVFNKQAKRAISNWRYKPNASTCHEVRLDFKMG